MLTDAIRPYGQEHRDAPGQKSSALPPLALRHRPFHKPVVIERRRLDRDRVVLNTKIALDSLLHEWPEDCPQRMRALKACLAVIRGQQPPVIARKAFIAAAKAANILREE